MKKSNENLNAQDRKDDESESDGEVRQNEIREIKNNFMKDSWRRSKEIGQDEIIDDIENEKIRQKNVLKEKSMLQSQGVNERKRKREQEQSNKVYKKRTTECDENQSIENENKGYDNLDQEETIINTKRDKPVQDKKESGIQKGQKQGKLTQGANATENKQKNNKKKEKRGDIKHVSSKKF